ncbi:hypothetical protein VIGAN_09092800, partial [Vigna angularis var. angularis]
KVVSSPTKETPPSNVLQIREIAYYSAPNFPYQISSNLGANRGPSSLSSDCTNVVVPIDFLILLKVFVLDSVPIPP